MQFGAREIFKSVAGLAIGALIAACQSAPTKVFETKENRDKATQETLKVQTILIDARPPFESDLAKPSGSINLQWDDFDQKDAPFEGELTKDLYFHARRLARLGIGPESDLLVFGRGKKGAFEEGRLAWTLRRMGIAHVRFASLDSINWPLNQGEAPPLPEVPQWKPQEDLSLEAGKNEALNRAAKGAWVLDVRVAADYLKDHDPFDGGLAPNRLINIPWTDFLNDKETAEKAFASKLATLGIQSGDDILVLDERSIQSAGVTLVLRDLGFSRASSWAGGYRELRAGTGKKRTR